MAHVGQEAAFQVRSLAQLFGLVVEFGIQRQYALVGFIQLGAQGVGFTLQARDHGGLFVDLTHGHFSHGLPPGQ
ncbi:hypothetical protein D3C73_1364980 [compost metagenome]